MERIGADVNDVVALGQPTFGSEEVQALAEVLASGWVAGQGPVGARFEAAFAELTRTAGTLAVSNCTAALHLAFLTLGAATGDEVIVADYTFPATGHAVSFTGATPVFADVRPDIWTIDVASAEALISERTVGIVAVDVAGQPADYDDLRQVADRHGLWVVEDAAAAAGATYKGRPAGSLADAAAFSFHGRKGITSGEGGALTSDREDLIAHARKLHAFGIEGARARETSLDLPVPEFDELGYNYKMSELAAAVMIVQLGRLPDLVARRREVAQAYAERLSDIEEIRLPVQLSDRTTVWQAYLLELAEGSPRGKIARYLRERGVQCNIGTYASHVQPLYNSQAHCPVSARLFERHLAIPMHANLTDDDVDRVCETLRAAIRNISVRNEETDV
jgi:dTDP-4-amino-4,6-dideoxygalactose transaminase